MKRIKIIITTLLLSVICCSSLVCQPVFAQLRTDLGTKNITGYEEGKNATGYDYIFLGKTDNKPIKWRVLSATGNATGATDTLTDDTGNSVDNSNSYFIMSEEIVDVYKNESTNNTKLQNGNFQGSLLQDWCKSIINGSHTSIVFSAKEIEILLNTTKDDEELEKTFGVNTYKFLGVGKELLNDKLFLLSANELVNPIYGFSGELDSDGNRIARWNDREAFWLLRQPPYAEVPFFAGLSVSVTTNEGGVMNLSTGVQDYGLRPAANLRKESILFASAAEGGKGDFDKVETNTTHEWKLTLKDDNSFADSASVDSDTCAPGKEIVIKHRKLVEISADYTNVTASISDKEGNLLYYGSIDADVNGTQSKLTIPADLVDGTYVLEVYGEDWNGDKFTDYATGVPFKTELIVDSKAGEETPKPTPTPPASAKVGQTVTVGNLKYKVTSIDVKNPAVTVTGTKTKKASVTVPATIKIGKVSYNVTEIANNAYKGNKKIKKIVIGANVKVIGKNAFKNCKNLKKIIVKSKVLKKVGAGALKGIHKKAVIKVPANKKKAYKKILKKKGQAKTVKIK